MNDGSPDARSSGRIVISGASGALGQRVAELLVERLPSQQLVRASRHPQALAGWAVRWATVVSMDPKDPTCLRCAYQGCDRLMLISGLNIGGAGRRARSGHRPRYLHLGGRRIRAT